MTASERHLGQCRFPVRKRSQVHFHWIESSQTRVEAAFYARTQP